MKFNTAGLCADAQLIAADMYMQRVAHRDYLENAKKRDPAKFERDPYAYALQESYTLLEKAKEELERILPTWEARVMGGIESDEEKARAIYEEGGVTG